MSRTDRPKQLLALASGKSLLRDTFERVEPLVGADRILVVTSGSLADATRNELPELSPEHIITEPRGRNTAPCAVLGMGLAGRLDSAAPVALLPADHFIPDDDAFRTQLSDAFALAAVTETVVTLGIPPTRPETGYGYLETAGPEDSRSSNRGLAFHEKPDPATAEEYVRSGNHFWNSGIFIWNPTRFVAASTLHLPEVVDLMTGPVQSFGTNAFMPALEDAYRDCPSDSIDFAIMEKLTDFLVLPATFRWSDLGSWDAWGELAPSLPGDNRGRGDLLAVESRDNILLATDRLVALVGVRDLIVVDTPDALLVCSKAEAQKIKQIISRLEDQGRSDLL
ncbi:MAG: mannose-1-phosphate guanylyltransferase [Candidatus Krumholzibacteria bacterium]|nr:mannose-1-phosphate guanylyltransferase [Candidatus Krumholzibacteria bacterium]